MRKGNAGFTLVELLVVIAIMSITFAAIPAFRDWQTISKTNTAARVLSSDLRLARSMAVDRNHDVVVTFDTATNSYAVYSDTAGDGPDVSDMVKSKTLESIGKGVIFDSTSGNGIGGVPITSPVMLGNTSDPIHVIMKPNGEAINVGAIYLVHRADLASMKSDRNRAVQVLKTGRIRMMRSDTTNPSDPWTEFY